MLKWLRYLLIAGWRIAYETLFPLRRYAKHPERYPIEVRYARVRKLIIRVFKVMRLDVQVSGLEKLKEREGTYLLVSNHLSDLDPLCYIYFSEKPISFVAKKEVLKMPVIGTALKAIDGVFMDRSNLKQSAQVLKTVSERLKEGKISYGIFPEGTRNKNTEAPLLPFHPGSFKPAAWADVPVLPAALYGTFRPLHGHPNDKRQPLFFTFLDDLDPKENSTELAEKAQGKIQTEVDKLREADKEYFKAGKQKVSLGKLGSPYVHD